MEPLYECLVHHFPSSIGGKRPELQTPLPQYDTQTFTDWPQLAEKVNRLLDRNFYASVKVLLLFYPHTVQLTPLNFSTLFLSYPICSHLSAPLSKSTLVNHHAVNFRLSPFEALKLYVLP